MADPLSRTFLALADPTRRAILAQIADQNDFINTGHDALLYAPQGRCCDGKVRHHAIDWRGYVDRLLADR